MEVFEEGHQPRFRAADAEASKYVQDPQLSLSIHSWFHVLRRPSH
jgi:hypothetical protein